jgi:hypothetical protein
LVLAIVLFGVGGIVNNRRGVPPLDADLTLSGKHVDFAKRFRPRLRREIVECGLTMLVPKLVRQCGGTDRDRIWLGGH